MLQPVLQDIKCSRALPVALSNYYYSNSMFFTYRAAQMHQNKYCYEVSEIMQILLLTWCICEHQVDLVPMHVHTYITLHISLFVMHIIEVARVYRTQNIIIHSIIGYLVSYNQYSDYITIISLALVFPFHNILVI